ncbi:hypothetical protein LPJ78_003121 [Coemansia sp. RSA 989]|nr:hypothetical protein LPJ78_003121 [Coemansia sp. RSA 989]
MSIAADYAQLQRQLYLLGYSQPLPEDGVQLVSMLLKDMQASLDRVKELEESSVKLEREERTSRAGNEKLRSELHALRTENNSMRTEVLNYTRELDKLRREARSEAYKTAKAVDDLKLENLRIRAESSENMRRFDECQKRLQAVIDGQDPGGRVPQIVQNRRPLPVERTSIAPEPPQPAIIDLVDLSSRRINALEEEIEILETKLQTASSELNAARLEVKERDLEIMRLNSEFKGADNSIRSGDDFQNTVARLNDQIDYLHERAETLERENKEQREQFHKEKEELRKRWVQTENERVRLSDQPAITSPVSPAVSNASSTAEVERLRAECANIKSLYAQTRDQLQDLLQSGNSDARQAREQAKSNESSLRQQLEEAQRTSADKIARLESQLSELQQQAADSSAFRELAQSRDREITQLKDQLQQSQRKITDLEAQMHSARSNATDAREAADACKAQYDATLSEYKQLVEQHRKLDRSLKQAVSEVGSLKKQLDERDHKLSNLARRCDEYRMSHKQNSSELRSCRRTLENYKSDLSTLRDAHDNIQQELDRLRDELAQAVRLRQAVEMSKDDYKRQLVKAMNENDSHRSLIDHLQAERRALRVQVKAQFHLSQRLEQRLESLDPNYAHEPISADSIPEPHPPLPRRAASRTSSAAHSLRSFDNIAKENEDSSASTISLP